ncbi:MAG: hypothetical protein ACLVKO_12620 [Dysgonomonas sp.]
MKIFILSIISILIILPLFFSCDSTDDDSEKPKIEIISLPDTLYIDSIDSAHVIAIRLTDNKLLSSYKIQFMPSPNMPYPDSIFGNYRDTLAYQRYVYPSRINIGGRDSITIRQIITLPSSTSKFDKNSNANKTYNVRTGYYNILVGCIDAAGNSDSIISPKDIMILYSSKFYKNPKK